MYLCIKIFNYSIKKKAQQPGGKSGVCNILYGPVCLRSSLQILCLYTQTHTHVICISHLHLFNIIIENSTTTLMEINTSIISPYVPCPVFNSGNVNNFWFPIS